MKKVNDVTYLGFTGNSYPFEIWEIPETYNELPGVYCFIKLEGDKHRLLYVGETGNLKERMADHHKEYCWTRNGAEYLAWHEEGRAGVRKSIERDLVRKHTPVCNQAVSL